MRLSPEIFRDYDIRAIIPGELDEAGLIRVAQAIAVCFQPRTIQVGRDMRMSSPKLHQIFVNTMLKAGVDVVDLGLISTDMLYFAAGKYNEDLAVTISASHNPPQYNGMKIVKRGAIAVSGDSGIYEIRDLAVSTKSLEKTSKETGRLSKRRVLNDFVKHVLKFINVKNMKPFKVAVDTGNGMGGVFMPAVEDHLPWKVTRIFYELDGSFPNHIPSPIEAKNMLDTVKAVKRVGADVGMAFDGDGDRVFLVDETGRIVSGTIMTALITENLLRKHPKQTILYNAIVGRVVPEIIKKRGGKPVRVRVGHTLIKEAMRKHNGLFCGEHSGHYFFRDFFYADSAIIAALLVLELMSVKNQKLSDLVRQYDKYPSSGEINFMVKDKLGVMRRLETTYKNKARSTDWLDGISVWFTDWWFNVRPSNTEPLLRLNIEADNHKILAEHTTEIVSFLSSHGTIRQA